MKQETQTRLRIQRSRTTAIEKIAKEDKVSNQGTIETSAAVPPDSNNQTIEREVIEMQEKTNRDILNQVSTEVAEETESLEEMDGELALEETRGEIEKIPVEEVRKFAAHSPYVVGIGLSYAQSYSQDRDLFRETFSPQAFDVNKYDNMDKRAQAFWHLDILKRQAEDPIGPVKELLEAAVPLRKKLLKAAAYLWEEHPVHGPVVEEIRSGNGHVNKADDLGSLAILFHEHWETVKGQCSVTKQDIMKAHKLGAAILKAKSPIKSKELDEIRILRGKAGEHLRRGIEDIRAGAYFIHRNEVEALNRYPSIFAKGKKRKNGTNGKDTAEPRQTATPLVQQVMTGETHPIT
ncbi:MAG: hypothetical protein GY847_27095 [Proteobacteria bacterium]|nr:hypothetical protein [Pseudomonadota bacterium]